MLIGWKQTTCDWLIDWLTTHGSCYVMSVYSYDQRRENLIKHKYFVTLLCICFFVFTSLKYSPWLDYPTFKQKEISRCFQTSRFSTIIILVKIIVFIYLYIFLPSDGFKLSTQPKKTLQMLGIKLMLVNIRYRFFSHLSQSVLDLRLFPFLLSSFNPGELNRKDLYITIPVQSSS